MTQAENLTPQAIQVLTFIQDRQGQWVNRAAIANMLGKAKLNSWHIELLEKLAGQGLIEIRRAEVLTSKSPVGFEWQYRSR